MYKFKAQFGSFLFTLHPPENDDEYTLKIQRGKAQIDIKLFPHIAANQEQLNAFVARFMEDIEFRQHLNNLSDPLNFKGTIDSETSASFFELKSASEQKIAEIIEKFESKTITRQDYIDFKFPKDEFSFMTEKQLRQKIADRKITARIARHIDITPLRRKAMRYYLRGVPILIVLEKAKIDRMYKSY